MYDRLFIDPEFSTKDLNYQANDLGLNASQYADCAEGNKYLNQIGQDMADGTSLGVRGTPTYFVNQTKIEAVVEAEVWNEVLMAEIKKTMQ